MSYLTVSVIIPTFNRASLVVRALESVLPQCRDGDEVIVVDDGSTDDTQDALAAYGDRIVYIRTANRGAGRARNLGLRQARNPLVAFLDSDDLWMPGKMDLQRSLMQAQHEVLFCFSDMARRDRFGTETYDHMATWHGDSRSWDEILGPGVSFSSLATLPAGREDFLVHLGDLYPEQMEGLFVASQTVMVRREAAGNALCFPEDLPLYEDWECYARLAGLGRAAYLDCETAWQCSHDGPRLTAADALTRATAHIMILERVWGSDSRFLSRHGGRYERILAGQRRHRARALISLGRTREARKELAQLHNASSLSDCVAAYLPGSLARWLLSARQTLSKVIVNNFR